MLPGNILEKETFLQFKQQVEARDKCRYYVPFGVFNELMDKSRTLTLKDVWMKQLLCIRGLSAEKALTIIQRYPTPNRYYNDDTALILSL
jgi:crossover junction endonuclease MUS81